MGSGQDQETRVTAVMPSGSLREDMHRGSFYSSLTLWALNPLQYIGEFGPQECHDWFAQIRQAPCGVDAASFSKLPAPLLSLLDKQGHVKPPKYKVTS